MIDLNGGVNVKVRIVLDILMLVLMLVAMSFRIIGGLTHEIIGVAILALFIIHNAFNFSWYKRLMGTKKRRIVNITNALLLLLALMLTSTGVMHSEKLLSLVSEEDNSATMSWKIHTVAAYWVFLLVSVHLGLYWHTMAKRLLPTRHKTAMLILKIAVLVTALWGIKAFITRKLVQKLTLYYSFDFWHTSEPFISYAASYFTIMVLFAVIAYYARRRSKSIIV